jgi:DNA-directed RNA polymerase subunit RPC12/RpoP
VRIAELRCSACGRERIVRQGEKGRAVACDGCGAEIQVPENLAFPEYAQLYRDRALAQTLEGATGLGFILCCLPACAVAWWMAAGAVQRAHEDGRPLDPALGRIRDVAMTASLAHAALWTWVALKWF